MERLFFCGRFVEEIIVSCLSDSIVQKKTQQSDGSCKLQLIPSFYTNFSRRGRDKILSTKESALENNFLFFSFLSESIWYV